MLGVCGGPTAMFRCPNEALASHAPPLQPFFVMTALIRVNPDCSLRDVQDHFLDVVVCGLCGADADDVDD